MSEAYQRILDALEVRGAKSRDVRQTHSMWQCPAHEDRGPSLAVDDKGDHALIHCHAGCHTDDVMGALGFTLADLFDGELDPTDRRGQLVRSYLYERMNGEPWFWVDRYYPKTFRQRLPTVEPVRDLGDKEGLKRLGLGTGNDKRPPIIYHAPRLFQAARQGQRTVWWLDGEKDVESAERDHLIATCPPGFAKWREEYASHIKSMGFTDVVMVVDQDKIKDDGTLGAGQANAVTARLGFRAAGLKVRIVSPAVGKDYTDHRAAGFGVDDFEVDTSVAIRPRGMSAAVLVTKEFEEVRWAVKGILPAGVTIFAGSPKVGKSWVALDLCAAVAAGGPALGNLPTVQGDTLYLAREDSFRRLQSRIALLMGGDLSEVPDRLELVPGEVEWVGGEEGIANLTEWAEGVKEPRLVVVDTIAKIEPDMGESRTRGAYTGNYSMMARYKTWADAHNVAVLMVHHDRKQSAGVKDKGGMAEDPFSKISGTRALTGAADTMWFLETVRGTGEGELHMTGRDVPEESIEMRKIGPLWQAFGIPEALRRST